MTSVYQLFIRHFLSFDEFIELLFLGCFCQIKANISGFIWGYLHFLSVQIIHTYHYLTQNWEWVSKNRINHSFFCKNIYDDATSLRVITESLIKRRQSLDALANIYFNRWVNRRQQGNIKYRLINCDIKSKMVILYVSRDSKHNCCCSNGSGIAIERKE